MSRPLRAAVIGGSGFGKFHAQWYAREGAEVVGYTCRSDETVEASEGPMLDLTHQHPSGYTDPALMIQCEKPDLVSICTPPAEHAPAVKLALQNNVHVMCEKPLLFNPEIPASQLLQEADELVDLAQTQGKILAVNLQYASVLPSYIDLYQKSWGAIETVNTYEFDMESKGNRYGPNLFEASWVELGPHTLTPLLMRFPTANLVEETLQSRLSEREVRIEMDFLEAGGHRIHVKLRTGACDKDAVPLRRFGMNNFMVDIISRRDETGTFQTYLHPVEEGDEQHEEDLMRLSLRQFLASVRGEGAPLVTGEQARRNLEIHLKILEHLKR